MPRLFSYKDRPVHLGPYPLERLKRRADLPDLSQVPPMRPLSFDDAENPESLTNAMAPFIGMFDAIRDGAVAPLPAEIPEDPLERANHLKAAGYYFDATQMGVCALPEQALLETPIRNPGLDRLVEDLSKGQPKSYAAGIDAIYADVLESARTRPTPVAHHRFAIVVLVEFTRDPRPDEPGTDWIHGTQAQRAALLSAQTAVIIANYIRLLGYEARAHSATSADVDLGRLTVAAGLAEILEDGDDRQLANPYVGTRYGVAAVTTTLELAPDRPLSPQTAAARLQSHGPA